MASGLILIRPKYSGGGAAPRQARRLLSQPRHRCVEHPCDRGSVSCGRGAQISALVCRTRLQKLHRTCTPSLNIRICPKPSAPQVRAHGGVLRTPPRRDMRHVHARLCARVQTCRCSTPPKGGSSACVHDKYCDKSATAAWRRTPRCYGRTESRDVPERSVLRCRATTLCDSTCLNAKHHS